MNKILWASLMLSLSISNDVSAAPASKILDLSFDGNITDASSLANTLTANGNISYVANRNGAVNKAIYFDGSSSLSVTPVSNFNVNGAYSISMWVKADRNSITEYIFSKVNPGRDMAVAIDNDGKFNTHIVGATSGAYQWCEDPATLTISTWYHIVAVYDGAKLNLYKNGTLVKSMTSYSPSWQGGTLTIGSLQGGYNFKGAIDDLQVINTALTATEVASMANDDLLLLYTPFDQSYADFSTKQNTVTITGTAAYTTDKTGAANKAFSFSGSNYLSVAPVSNFDNLKSYSVSVWVKPSSTATEYYFSKASPGRDMILAIDNNGKFDTHIVGATGGGYQWCEDPATLTINTWYHIVSVYDGTNLNLYKNGILVKSIASYSPSWKATTLHIGALNGGYNFTGALDELRVYGRAITPNEISVLYNGGITTDVAALTLESADVKLAPNPAKNQVKVLGVDGTVDIIVSDALGNVVLTSTQATLDLSGVNTGLYFVKVNSKGANTTLKLVVE